MKEKFKKVISLALVLLTTISVVGCSCDGNNTGGSDSSSDNSSDEQNTMITDIYLVNNSTTDYKIVIPEKATECISYAGQELQKYIRTATGANMEIITDT